MNEQIQYNEKEIPTKIRPVANSRTYYMNHVWIYVERRNRAWAQMT